MKKKSIGWYTFFVHLCMRVSRNFERIGGQGFRDRGETLDLLATSRRVSRQNAVSACFNKPARKQEGGSSSGRVSRRAHSSLFDWNINQLRFFRILRFVYYAICRERIESRLENFRKLFNEHKFTGCHLNTLAAMNKLLSVPLNGRCYHLI